MKSNIRITLSELATVELLELMKSMNIQNPTHCANTIITEYYKSRLSHTNEEYPHDQRSTSNH